MGDDVVKKIRQALKEDGATRDIAAQFNSDELLLIELKEAYDVAVEDERAAVTHRKKLEAEIELVRRRIAHRDEQGSGEGSVSGQM